MSEVEECPECGSLNLVRDYERAELSCGKCGLVIQEKIEDLGPEWRAFDQEQLEKKSRTGPPMSLTICDKGLSTIIDWRDPDGVKKTLSLDRRLDISRLRKLQRVEALDAYKRNLALAFSKLKTMTSKFNIGRDVEESAALTYRRALERGLGRGRSTEAMVTAVVYATCRYYGIPITLNEIISVTQARWKEVSKCYRSIIRGLSFKVPPQDPIDYIPRFANKLGLSGENQAKAIEILREVKERRISLGKSALGTVAAALYMASVLSGYRLAQRDVAKAAEVSEATLRNRYKELMEELSYFSSSSLNKYRVKSKT